MENTRPQPCGQAHVQDAFHLEAIRDDAGRKALFVRMCREGLTGCAMYAWPHPREDDWLHLVSAPGACSCRPRPLTARRWPADCSAPGAGGSGNSISRSSARHSRWPCRWPVPLSAGSSVIRRPARFGACARSATAMPGVWPRPAVSLSRGACPPPAGWPGAASTWTASSCSARRRRWRAP